MAHRSLLNNEAVKCVPVSFEILLEIFSFEFSSWGHSSRDRMVGRFAISVYHVHGEVYLIQHYVIKFVSGLRQTGGFLRVLQFPPPIKLAATI
jgi:hypothetical protein